MNTDWSSSAELDNYMAARRSHSTSEDPIVQPNTQSDAIS